MTPRAPKYPFVPKSTVHLEPGHFWSFPLLGDRYACGRVLQVKTNADGTRDRRMFLAGLLDWCATEPPTFDSIAGAKLVDHGAVHIRTISHNGGQIIGLRPLELDHLEIPLTLSQRAAHGCKLTRGFDTLGTATVEQITMLPVFSTWGYRVINVLAEHRFLASNTSLESRRSASAARLGR